MPSGTCSRRALAGAITLVASLIDARWSFAAGGRIQFDLRSHPRIARARDPAMVENGAARAVMAWQWLTVEQARKSAKEMLAAVTKGLDPAEQRLEERKAMTVRQLCYAYVDAAAKGLVSWEARSAKEGLDIVHRPRAYRAAHLAIAWKPKGA